jgi:opacity protein-like surface antigen
MKKTLMATAIIAAFAAAPAFAGPYVGAGVGSARTDSNNTGTKVFAGFQSTENLGFQVAYNNFGGYRGAKATAWSVAVVGTMPIDPNWDVFAKVGATENRTTLPGSGRHSDVLLGMGVGYNFNKNVALRFEYEDFGKLPADNLGNRWKATNWGVNVKYTF